MKQNLGWDHRNFGQNPGQNKPIHKLTFYSICSGPQLGISVLILYRVRPGGSLPEYIPIAGVQFFTVSWIFLFSAADHNRKKQAESLCYKYKQSSTICQVVGQKLKYIEMS